MVLKGLNGTLGIVGAMVTGRCQLDLDAFGDEVGDEGGGGCVVGDFVDWYAAAVRVSIFVGGYCVEVGFEVGSGVVGGEGFGAYVVGVEVVGYQEVDASVQDGAGGVRVICKGGGVDVHANFSRLNIG